jgi:hypothetical protein
MHLLGAIQEKTLATRLENATLGELLDNGLLSPLIALSVWLRQASSQNPQKIPYVNSLL